jgi:hypothetical protein
MTSGEIIALCSLGVAVAGLSWKLIQDRRDKAILKVDAKFGIAQPALFGEPVGEPKQCLQVTITNNGHRPITVNNVGGRWREARLEGDHFTFMPPNDLPKRFEPGDSHTEIYWKPEQLSILTPNLKQIWARDAAGKCWCANKKDIEDLIVWGRVINKQESSAQT